MIAHNSRVLLRILSSACLVLKPSKGGIRCGFASWFVVQTESFGLNHIIICSYVLLLFTLQDKMIQNKCFKYQKRESIKCVCVIVLIVILLGATLLAT